MDLLLYMCMLPFSPPSGLISRQAISRAKGLIREALLTALDDDTAFDKWFGAQVTRSVHWSEYVCMSMVVIFFT